jgi:hypothetical protein
LDKALQRLLKNGGVVRTGYELVPVEATAVVAVAMLVIAILMPAMRKVKEQAEMFKCLANLGRWNFAISRYVEDSEGRFLSGCGTLK